MPDTDTSRESPAQLETDQAFDPQTDRRLVTWRSILVTLVLLAIVLMAVLPPLLNVSRFKRRIVTSISTSIGRPVHLDNVSLVLLPFPGFKLENFVVAEDPAFGSEPVIHANSVLATLRVSSLWRRRVEFSKISLEEPSINLVHNANGLWNVQSILLQAAHIPAAPTVQAKPSADPRFPYIEATGARVNIKSGLEKLPFSLTEADFALWLPSPQQWRIRLVAKPTRTDTNASDTGTISLEGSLGHAERFEDIPLELSAEWKNAPLGEASRVLTGRDAGLRGDLRLNLSATGTIGSSDIKSTLNLLNARRAGFVPDHPLNLHAECEVTSADTFHAFHQLRCTWPPATSDRNTQALIAITGDVPDIHDPASAMFEIGTPGLPAATLLNWLRIASPRVPADVDATGTLTGSITTSGTTLTGSLNMTGFSLNGGPLGTTPVKFGDLTLSSSQIAAPSPHTRRLRAAVPAPPNGTFYLSPATITLGGKEPATIEGRIDTSGETLHLNGSLLESRLLALAAAIPQFGDGLRAVLPAPNPQSANETPKRPELPIHVDLNSTRPWRGSETWTNAFAALSSKTVHHHR
jgi:AsmA protein